MCYIIQVEKNQQHVGFIMYYFLKWPSWKDSKSTPILSWQGIATKAGFWVACGWLEHEKEFLSTVSVAKTTCNYFLSGVA